MEMNDILNSDSEFRYKLLDRMRSDCEYYMGHGNRHPKDLWAKTEAEHIACMKALWESFGEEEKPEWLSMEKIIEYEVMMVPESKDKTQEAISASVDLIVTEESVYKLLEGAQTAAGYPNLNVNSLEYKKAMDLTEEFCQRAWPELYETVFGSSDMDFFFKDIPGYDFVMFYYNPDSNCGGQFVKCPFHGEQAAEMIGDDVYMDVLAANTQFLCDIDSYHFFDTFFELIELKSNGKYLGHDVNEVCREIIRNNIIWIPLDEDMCISVCFDKDDHFGDQLAMKLEKRGYKGYMGPACNLLCDESYYTGGLSEESIRNTLREICEGADHQRNLSDDDFTIKRGAGVPLADQADLIRSVTDRIRSSFGLNPPRLYSKLVEVQQRAGNNAIQNQPKCQVPEISL